MRRFSAHTRECSPRDRDDSERICDARITGLNRAGRLLPIGWSQCLAEQGLPNHLLGSRRLLLHRSGGDEAERRVRLGREGREEPIDAPAVRTTIRVSLLTSGAARQPQARPGTAASKWRRTRSGSSSQLPKRKRAQECARQDGRPDDVAYVSDVITGLAARVCIDQTRVHATGFSSSGRTWSLLGCKLGSRIAAIAPVSGLRSPGPCTTVRSGSARGLHTVDAVCNIYPVNPVGARSLEGH